MAKNEGTKILCTKRLSETKQNYFSFDGLGGISCVMSAVYKLSANIYELFFRLANEKQLKWRQLIIQSDATKSHINNGKLIEYWINAALLLRSILYCSTRNKMATWIPTFFMSNTYVWCFLHSYFPCGWTVDMCLVYLKCNHKGTVLGIHIFLLMRLGWTIPLFVLRVVWNSILWEFLS